MREVSRLHAYMGGSMVHCRGFNVVGFLSERMGCIRASYADA